MNLDRYLHGQLSVCLTIVALTVTLSATSLYSCVQALCLITERLAQLHGSGWVHRDLKPGNVLRLPGQHSWTLMDFGCAARSGALLQECSRSQHG